MSCQAVREGRQDHRGVEGPLCSRTADSGCAVVGLGRSMALVKILAIVDPEQCVLAEKK